MENDFLARFKESNGILMNTKMFNLEGKYLKAFVGLALFSLMYILPIILPIILANFYYIDDLGRSLHGRTGWEGNGRPLASLLAIIFSDGKPLMDISPWIQIASAILFDYALILFVKKYVPKASAFKLFCVASFGYLNLFLLENFSYKYDSLGMILSLSIFLVLYSLPEALRLKKSILLSAGCVVAALSLYQASIGAYLSLAVVECIFLLYGLNSWTIVFRRLMVRLAGILGGYVIYKLAVIQIFVSKEGYSADHASLLNPLSSQGIQRFLENTVTFCKMFKVYGISMGILGVFLLVVLCIGIVYMAHSIWCRRNDSAFVKLLSIVIVLMSPFLLIITSVIALMLLESPVFAPRVMISFTIFTLFIGLVIYQLSEIKRGFISVAALTLICTLSFSSYYGNLLSRQDKMNTLVTTYLVYDMNAIETKQGRPIDKVSFIGHSPQSQELIFASKKRPLFAYLIPIYMNNDWGWGGYYLSHYRKKPVKLQRDKQDKNYADSHPAIQQNEFYRLYLSDNKLIVVFQKD